MFDLNKHYIRVENGLVVKGFSDAFETPSNTDICINKKGGRHFEIDGVINPPLYDEKMCHIYRYDTELRKATAEEIKSEWQKIKPEEPVTEEDIALDLLADHEYRLCILELG